MERSELVGGVIGDKYAVKGILGEGGMGVVYEAEHLAMGRIVAIKVLHPENAQKREAVSRLAHEAKVTGNLGHPNICEIYDMGRLDDGSPYVVMERLRGETLAQRIKRDGKVEPGPVVEIAMQVLSALAAAHASGIIHRDLKPENVFLAEKPGGLVVTKLLDFGISKAMLAAGDEDRLGLTQTGMVMGTPYYMAPEQARGDRALDSRVDIWAVGVMMYEAMTGRRPFLAKNYNALLVKILTVWHRSLAEVDPTIPPALALAVDKALSKMPEDRYKNAGDMQEALKRFLPKKEVAFPTSFALPSVRPVVETAPAAQQGSSKPPTFGLPELDLHDETADGVPWTAVKQYVPTGPRNAVNAAIAAQQQAPSQASPQQAPQPHAPQPQAPHQAPQQQAPQQQAPQQHAPPQQAPHQAPPQQASPYASRERGPESARAGIPAPRPTPVMPVVVPPAAIPPAMSARGSASAGSPSETLRERASEGAAPAMQGRAPSAGPTSVRYPQVPSAPTGPPPPTPGQAWSPRNEAPGASAPRPPQAGSPGAPAAGPLPAPNAPRMAARRAATPPRPPAPGFGGSPGSPASGAPQAPSPAAYPSPSSPITGAPQAPQAPAQAAYANPQPNPYAAPQAPQPSHQAPQTSHPAPQTSHPAQSYQAPAPAYQAPQGYAPPQAQNPYSGSPQAAPQGAYAGSQASPQAPQPGASPSPQSAYSGASPSPSPHGASPSPHGASPSPHGASPSPQSPYSGSPQASPQAPQHHAPQTSGGSPPYAPRPAMPPQVSAAPTTGQAQGAPFAPRPGPAARVSAARAQKSPFPTPEPEPPTVEDDATISEESSDGDDDQIETLVLVRDKLPLAKKLT